MRDQPVYALVVAKTGPKLKPASDGKFAIRTGRGHLEIHDVSLPVFVSYLWGLRAADRPVVDATGFEGFFDITFDWTPDNIQPDTATGASVFTAVEEQLGLRLESRKSPFEFIVIDHVERPSEN